MLSTFSTAFSAALFSLSSPTPVADVYVDLAQAGCATGTGSMSNPVCSIADAISLAAPGDTIRIAPGTYSENVVINFNLELVGTGGMSVTTIDGGASGSVVTIPSAVVVTMEGLTITGGSAPVGGGVLLGGVLALSNSTITGNTATTGDGGGVGSSGAGAVLIAENCLVQNNDSLQSNGGGIGVTDGSVTLVGSVMSGNTARRFGGGLFFDSSLPGDLLNIDECTFTGNETTNLFGGGMSHSGGFMNLSNSTFSDNEAALAGGGIDITRAQFSITNTTVSGNRAREAGGIMFFGPETMGAVANSTITNNVSTGYSGGGIYSIPDALPISFRGTIVAGNTVPPQFFYDGGDSYGYFVTLGNNLIGEDPRGWADAALNDLAGDVGSALDPLLGPLQDNGGPTETHQLLVGSPAVDAGNSAFLDAADQRGISRPQGAAPDIGAVESRVRTSLCQGDGGDGMGCTPCPCGNDAVAGTLGGCQNSSGFGALMTRSGNIRITGADLRFEAQGLPANTAAILLSGTAIAPAGPMNPCFGLGSGITQPTVLDGLRCIVQGVLRHGVRAADANGDVGVTTAGWGNPNNFLNLGAFMVGETRFFQVTYRDDPLFGCGTGLNTTQAEQVTFVP